MLSPFSSVLTTSYAIVTGFREYPYTPHHHGRLLEIPKRVGSLKPNFFKGKYEVNFQRDIGWAGGEGEYEDVLEKHV